METKRFRFARLASALGLAFVVVAGCSHDPPPPTKEAPPAPCTEPESFGIRLTASGRLNPGDHGEPLATVVRIYQLKRPEKLTTASFDDILDHDKDVIGADLCEVQEVTLSPGETIPRALKRAQDAAYIAAVALYRKPSGNGWRAVKQLTAPDPQRCHPPAGKQASELEKARFFFDGNRVELR
jgi:type VI secretion system protein VasD